MPLIRSSASKRRAYVMAMIFLLSKIMPTYFRCMLRGLVYIIIISLFSRQPFSYAKYTKSNIRSSYNIKSVSIAECMFSTRYYNL